MCGFSLESTIGCSLLMWNCVSFSPWTGMKNEFSFSDMKYRQYNMQKYVLQDKFIHFNKCFFLIGKIGGSVCSYLLVFSNCPNIRKCEPLFNRTNIYICVLFSFLRTSLIGWIWWNTSSSHHWMTVWKYFFFSDLPNIQKRDAHLWLLKKPEACASIKQEKYLGIFIFLYPKKICIHFWHPTGLICRKV
jgi:hypothetical protein